MALRMNGRLEVRVDDALDRRLDALAEMTGRTRADVVRLLIRNAQPVNIGGISLPHVPATERDPAPEPVAAAV